MSMKIQNHTKKRIINTLIPLMSRTDGTGDMASVVLQNTIQSDGGPGSGNWGHKGIKGQVGGSKPGGGAHNRVGSSQTQFTSYAKRAKEAAKKRMYGPNDRIIAGSKIIGVKGNFEALPYGKIKDMDTGKEYASAHEFCQKFGPFGTVLPSHIKNESYQIPKLTDGDYSSDRKKRAFKATDPAQFDKAFRQKSGEVWRGLDKEAKESFAEYTTEGYTGINSELRNGNYKEGSQNAKHIDAITAAIDKSTLGRDIQLRRGVSASGVAKFLGCKPEDLQDDDFLNSLVGVARKDDAFMSCGSTVNQGAIEDINFDIFVPKGMKALYCEPFSENGSGDGKFWDGKKTQDYYGMECETLLQRGSALKITGWYRDSRDKVHLQCECISQTPYARKN